MTKNRHSFGRPKPFVYNPPMEPYLSILYQDEAMAVLCKPSGLLSVPGKPAEHADCLESRMRERFPSVSAVHRLDMDTSGVMVMTLNKPALANLSQQFEKRQVEKRYIARVYGRLTDMHGTVDQPLICDWPNRPMQKIDHDAGKRAVTGWEVVTHEEGSTRVRLFPQTGRSHQLRVHMAYLGHPILGDNLYAHDEAYNGADRLMLHAEYLKVRHPVTSEDMEFRCKCGF